MGALGLALLAIGIPRLPAEIVDVPGNGAASALADGVYVNPEGAELVLETRLDSLSRDANARRWFAAARAHMVSGNPRGAAESFEEGLRLAPGNGVVWAEYALALLKSGDRAKARQAREYSMVRAPHDPRARSLRRLMDRQRK